MHKIKLHYPGSKGWLIFWAIVLFPVAFVLLLTAGRFEMNGQNYSVTYDGSRGWLAFWTVAFFPIAFILLLLNGFAVHTDGRHLAAGQPLNGPQAPTGSVSA
jgi:hypothetical protein